MNSAVNLLSISVTFSYFKIYVFIYILFLNRLEKNIRIVYAAENIQRDTVVFETTHGKFLLKCLTKQQHFTSGAKHLPIRSTSILVLCVVFCTSLFVHFSYFNLAVVLFIHIFSASNYTFGIFKLYLSSFKLFFQQMADSRQNHCPLISIWFTVALVPLLVFFS